MDVTEFKRRAAERAVELVAGSMVVGLGHGTTAVWAVRRIGRLLAAGKLAGILAVPCSRQVEADARAAGIPLTTLDAHPVLDLTIDGADEVDPNLDVIKGGGGALLREKIVAAASRREIIVVDDRKLVPALGTRVAVPVEVAPFGLAAQAAFLESLGATVARRFDASGEPFLTDQGNEILDCRFGPIRDPHALAAKMNARPGIIEHGLFLDLVTDVIIAGPRGIEHRRRST